MGPLGFSIYTDIAFPIIGFLIARIVPRLDERSLAAVCLFIFTPAVMFRLSMGQSPGEHQFSFILFFILFHTALLFGLTSQFFTWIGSALPMRHFYIVNVMLIGFSGLNQLKLLWPDANQGVPVVNTLIFFHLVTLATLGIYLCAGRERLLERFLDIFKTPFLYVIVVGLGLSIAHVELQYELLAAIDDLYTMAIPAALIISGIVFGRMVYFVQIDECFGLLPGIGLCLVLKLLISPLIALLIVSLMGIEDLYLKRALVLSSAAPTGVYAVMLAAFYGRAAEKRFTILCVSLGVLLSFLSIPLVQLAVNYYIPIGE
ncbi:MAG: hypothetical protein P9L94_06030 [Candidatus Hinthialibacter antarcticus]|nr:hypothetical protein [Candidatus Hinthialibacter antarcticus]